MDQAFIVDFAMDSIKTTLLLSAPMLGFGLVTGLIVSIFQAVTSIQELTLTFIPKIIAVFFSLILFFPLGSHPASHFTHGSKQWVGPIVRFYRFIGNRF